MQVFTDIHGVQQLDPGGNIYVDPVTGEPSRPIIADTANGDAIDPALVGGYSRVNGMLQWSQAVWDANEALKGNQQAAIVTEWKQSTRGITEQSTPEAIRLRAVVQLMLDQINLLRAELRALKANGAAAANTVAGVKGVFAAISALPEIKPDQARDAFKARVTADKGNLS